MPNLENLRKQAKQYLRWHRERHYPVASQIRATLPRFQGMDDQEVLASVFRLADAQELVARQEGYESWDALKHGAVAVNQPHRDEPNATYLRGTEAQLYVSDIAISVDYFKKLGFKVSFVYGQPPFYAMVARDQAHLCLRLVCEPVFVGDIREREQLLSASITLKTAREIKALYSEFLTAEADFFQGLKKQPWNARNFIIRDPDGNLIMFAGPAD